jgi:hemoglobin
MKHFFVILLLILGCAATPASAAKGRRRGKKAPATKTLFDRLGQKKGIAELVDDFVSNCAADTRINAFFAATAADPARLTQFKERLGEQLCEISEGPCRYSGKSMKEAHVGMHVRAEHFTALVDDFAKALDKRKVKPADREKLLETLEPLKAEIVDSAG